MSTESLRLVGLDVARCLALLGMVATHVLPDRGPDGGLALGQAVAGGRSAALFAVLAGVGLALVSGRTEPSRGHERGARSVGIAIRALVIAALGLLLGDLDSGLAVILTYYGVLFLLALPFLGLGAGALLAVALGWAVTVPVVSHLVRPALPARGYGNPDLAQLGEPGRLVAEVLLTGYYPALPWLTYLLVGLAVGRTDLSRRHSQAGLVAGGLLAAGAATAASRALTSRADVRAELLADGGPPASSADELMERVAGGMYGTTPTGGPWEWLLVVSPHSSTPFDLLQTAGSAVAVIGAALLVCSVLGPLGRRATAVFFGAGTMTLTLYSVHVVMRTPDVPPAETAASFPVHVLVLLAVGAAFVACRVRGPMEWLVHVAARSAARLVRPARSGEGP